MVNTILAKRINHIVAKGDNPVWPKGSKSRGFSTWPCLYGKNTNYLCLWLWGLGYGMLVFPDMFLFRKIAAVYMAFSERNVIFAGEIKSYLKA